MPFPCGPVVSFFSFFILHWMTDVARPPRRRPLPNDGQHPQSRERKEKKETSPLSPSLPLRRGKSAAAGMAWRSVAGRGQKGPTGKAGGSSYAPIRLFYQLRPNRRITVCHLHICYLRPVNGLPAYGRLSCVPSLSSSCLRIYSQIFVAFLPTVST